MAATAPTTLTLHDSIQRRKQGDVVGGGKKHAFFAWMISHQEGQTFPVGLTVIDQNESHVYTPQCFLKCDPQNSSSNITWDLSC